MSTYATTADEFVSRIEAYQKKLRAIIGIATEKQILPEDDASILRQLYGLENNRFVGSTDIRRALGYTDAMMQKRVTKIWAKLSEFEDTPNLRICLNNLLRSMPDCVRFAVKS